MNYSRARLAAAAVGLAACALAASAFAGSARAAETPSFFGRGADHAVFVQTDNIAGNQVVAYHRAPDGTLTATGTYATGGLGGILAGSVVDHLASQGSLTYDQRHGLLYAVNAGSNTVSVFSVRGDRLTLIQVLASGGTFPVSIAVHGRRRLRSQRRERRERAGLFRSVRPPDRDPGIESSPRARSRGDAAVRQHAGTGRILAGRLQADRDHEGQRQRGRRVRRRTVRAAVRRSGRELGARYRAVRDQLRPRWTPRDRGSRDERARHVHAQP